MGTVIQYAKLSEMVYVFLCARSHIMFKTGIENNITEHVVG